MTGTLTIQFLDAGQGDSIYIEFPDGETNMLIDMGTNGFGKTTAEKRSLRHDSLFAWFRDNPNIVRDEGRLDFLVLTHGDTDHYNLLYPFLEYCKAIIPAGTTNNRVRIGLLIHGGLAGDYGVVVAQRDEAGKTRTEPYNQIRYLEDQYGVTTAAEGVIGSLVRMPAFAGSTDEFSIDVVANNLLSGLSGGRSRRRTGHVKNSDSVVLLIKFAGTKILLTGDATVDTEKRMWVLDNHRDNANRNDLADIDVLKIAHHGSARHCNSPEFIRYLNPRMAFFTAGRSGELDGTVATGHKLPNLAVFSSLVTCDAMQEDGSTMHGLVMAYYPYSFGTHTASLLPNRGLSDDNRANREVLPPYRNPYLEFMNRNQWVTVRTPLPIFGTVVQAGIDSGEADLGSQYTLTVSASGDMNVAASDHHLTGRSTTQVSAPRQLIPMQVLSADEQADLDAKLATLDLRGMLPAAPRDPLASFSLAPVAADSTTSSTSRGTSASGSSSAPPVRRSVVRSVPSSVSTIIPRPRVSAERDGARKRKRRAASMASSSSIADPIDTTKGKKMGAENPDSDATPIRATVPAVRDAFVTTGKMATTSIRPTVAMDPLA